MIKKNKEYLGRKILDLIEENDIKIVDNEEVYDIELERISQNPNQPRTYFNEASLNELARSIEKHGVIQPVILKPENDGLFTLIAGERRVRASKIAKKQTIPAIVRDYDLKNSIELSVLENLQREDLTSIEEGIAYKTITSKLDISHAKLAEQLGKSRSHITNMIGLVNLPEYIIKALNEGKISMGHARVMSKIKSTKVLELLFNKLINNNWSVRELEKAVRDLRNQNENNVYKDIRVSKLNKIFKNSSQVDVKNNKLIIEFQNKTKLDDYINSLIAGDDNE